MHRTPSASAAGAIADRAERVHATLQINLAPSDHRYAHLLLPHQLRQWGAQADEVLLTVDLRRSNGRFGEDWDAGRRRLFEVIDGCKALHPGMRVAEVDYSPASKQRVADLFFGGALPSVKDARGGPYYSYFFGLAEAAHDLILHSDSDMFFGGGSQTWLDEARSLFAADPRIVTVSPLPGPPSADGTLVGQPARVYAGRDRAYEMEGFSTRTFALVRSRFLALVCPLRPRSAPPRAALAARLRGHPPVELPEETIGRQYRAAGLRRVDFLGDGAGMWSLHPPFRSPEFFAALPDLVRRVERDEIPEAQRGWYDVSDALVDWTSAREALRQRAWWRQLARRTGLGPLVPTARAQRGAAGSVS